MIEQRDPHAGLHSAQGARAGEHPGRVVNPVVKVHDLAWLEFEKPDLGRAEVFGRAFGFAPVLRTDGAIVVDDFLPPATEPPQRLHEAMRYAVLSDGKRIRPVLEGTVPDEIRITGGAARSATL